MISILPSSASCRLRSALGDHLEPGPLQIICLDAALWHHAAVDQALKDAPRHSDDPLIFADADAELDGLVIGVPARVIFGSLP